MDALITCLLFIGPAMIAIAFKIYLLGDDNDDTSD
jgi:hypothetical protein